jgi:hypothetical protein
MSGEIESLLELMDTQKIDSRLKGYNGLVTHPVLNAERTFCIVCGKEKGWVSMESSEFIRANNIIVICDNCEADLGALPLPMANIEEVDIG